MPIFFISRHREKIWTQSRAGSDMAKELESSIENLKEFAGGDPLENEGEMRESILSLKLTSAAMVFPYWVSPNSFKICLIYSIMTFAISITSVPGFVFGFLQCSPKVALWIGSTFFAKK